MSIQAGVLPACRVALIAASVGLFAASVVFARDQAAAPATRAPACQNAGLKLPAGFCATVFADHIGHARHLAVAGSGVVYVTTWSGRYYGNQPPPAGGFLVALQDTSGRGKADVVRRFGPTPAEGGKGGTGIALYRDALDAEESDLIANRPGCGCRESCRRAA